MPASSDRPGSSAPLTRRKARGAGTSEKPPTERGGGEFAFLAKVRAAVEKGGRARGVIVGIGDDCAVVEAPCAPSRLVLTTDTMVEGVHFERNWLKPRELGVRAFRAAVSDIAAMGARPRHVLLSLEIPAEGFPTRDALAVVGAIAKEARLVGASLVGGNVSAATRLSVTVTVVGEAASKPLLRRSAKAGDLVFVTGSLGGAAAGWRALAAGGAAATKASRALTSAYRRPPLRLDFAADLAARGLAHAMIDVSDGLLQDLGHVAKESGVQIRVDAKTVPVHRAATATATATVAAVTTVQVAHKSPKRPPDRVIAEVVGQPARELALIGGEDYELAFSAPSSRLKDIEALAAKHRTLVTVIGGVARGRGVTDCEGRPFALAAKGFDHLRQQRPRVTKKPR